MPEAGLLVKMLQQSQILQPDQMAEVEGRLQRKTPDLKELAQELLRLEWITPYQLKKLALGQSASLVLGPYVLLERLGVGGMGEVFKARHMIMNRIVAVKVLRTELVKQADLVQRFHREVAAAAKLVHPNIVVAYDAAEIDGRHFMAMEYAHGHTLKRRMQRLGQLPVGTACEYVRQAAQGLQHAHEQGLVHRDIKPSNLLLTHDPVSNRPLIKILDFGLARFTSEQVGALPSITAEGLAMGTPDFMSPEQAQNARAADIRADIYSLGCVLFYFLTGKSPFAGKSMLERLAARLTSDPLPLRQLCPEVTPELEQVVKGMMARDPANRYQIPAEVVSAVAPFANITKTSASGGRKPAVLELPELPTASSPASVPTHAPASSWFLSCMLVLLGFSTVVVIGAAAFVVFLLMYRNQ
jgi:serine/threonine-protein kinase